MFCCFIQYPNCFIAFGWSLSCQCEAVKCVVFIEWRTLSLQQNYRQIYSLRLLIQVFACLLGWRCFEEEADSKSAAGRSSVISQILVKVKAGCPLRSSPGVQSCLRRRRKINPKTSYGFNKFAVVFSLWSLFAMYYISYCCSIQILFFLCCELWQSMFNPRTGLRKHQHSCERYLQL